MSEQLAQRLWLGFLIVATCGVLVPVGCKELPTITATPTSTVTTAATTTATGAPTISPSRTPCAPMQRALDDVNAFRIETAEWLAWNEYDSILRKIDAARKAAGNCAGLSADEQMEIWMNALRKFGATE